MNIIIYSTPLWPWCYKVKGYLKNSNIDFKEINVMFDRKGASEMVKKSGQQGVPVIDIDGSIVIGFDKQAIDKLLGI